MQSSANFLIASERLDRGAYIISYQVIICLHIYHRLIPTINTSYLVNTTSSPILHIPRIRNTATMSDANNPNRESRETPQWALYQRENFWKSNEGEVPIFNTGKIQTDRPSLRYTTPPPSPPTILTNPTPQKQILANSKNSPKKSSA